MVDFCQGEEGYQEQCDIFHNQSSKVEKTLCIFSQKLQSNFNLLGEENQITQDHDYTQE